MANEDWDKAVRRIEEARAEEAIDLHLVGLGIDSLPEGIADLHSLQTLNLDGTKVTDLGALSGLHSLQYLNLIATKVTDLGPLSGLHSMGYLYLNHTQVTDLAPLAGLHSLRTLDLDSAKVTDLGPLSGLQSLHVLNLNDTEVTDLRPILTTGLATKHPDINDKLAVSFSATPACNDPVIAAMAKIEDDADRLQALLAHLRTLPSWPEPLTPHWTDGAGASASDPLAIKTTERQIAFLLEHAAVSQIAAKDTASQIRFALHDVPATDGNKMPAVLESMANVARILDRLGDRDALTEDDLKAQIADLEATIADLTTKLSDAEQAKKAAEALAKANGFWAEYRSSVAKASGVATVAATFGLVTVACPSAMIYFLGIDHPAVQALLTILGKLPKTAS